jgi:hypothetical protein
MKHPSSPSTFIRQLYKIHLRLEASFAAAHCGLRDCPRLAGLPVERYAFRLAGLPVERYASRLAGLPVHIPAPASA